MRKVYLAIIGLLVFILLTACQNSSQETLSSNTTSVTTEVTTEVTVPVETTISTEATTTPTPSVPETNTETTQKPAKPSTTKPSQQPTQGSTNTTTEPEAGIIAQGTCVGTAGKWKITEDGTLTIYGNAHPEDSYSYKWAEHSDKVKKVVVEEGITHVPISAFFLFKNLTEVVLADSVETIGEDAFSNCTALSKITIPPKVTQLKTGTFAGCTSLTSISYAPGSQLHTLNAGVFGASGLKEFVAPPNLRLIKTRAFVDMPALETIILTGSVEKLEPQAVIDCRLLKKVVLGSNIISIGNYAFNGCTTIMHYESYASKNISLSSLPHLKTVIIGGDVSGLSRFTNSSTLTDVTITSPITEITGGQFMGCTSLTKITLPETIKTIGNNAFVNSGIKELTLPASVEELGLSLFNKSSLQTITFTGDPPVFKSNITESTFTGLDKLTAYYPADNPAWTKAVLKNYGAGEVTWIAK